MKITTTYAVQYQKDNDPHWWAHDGRHFSGATGHLGMETGDLDEAVSVATGLFDGRLHIDRRPEFRDHVTATKVTQYIYVDGTLLTFGSPVEKTTE